ncbi:MAG TPA: phosphoadenosine phosphosulfate reductase family protein [Acidimicrobiales bacterium]|nr:phosphoadenosine phosphosulfate reductase family protein [Acidimicrobiales bacterium]
MQMVLGELDTDAAPVDLTSYDVVLVNSSAGKDSQAMLDYIAELAHAAGVADRVVVFHADLGRVEWDGTAELAQEHAAHYGFRFIKLAKARLDLLERVEERGSWPDAARRWCTSDFKRAVSYRVLTQLAAERRDAGHTGPIRVLNCMGLRAEESPARAKKLAFRHDPNASNGRRHVDEWLPILHWTVGDVWARIAAAGTRAHEAYALGMPRLSCSFCVLSSKNALIRAAQLRPNLAAEYAAVEARIGHKFRQNLSMADIIEAAKTADATAPIDGWNH